MGKVISSLVFLALLAMSSAASAIPIKMLKHNQRSSGGTLSTLAWKDCGSVGPFISPCLNPTNPWIVANGVTGSTVTWDWNPATRVLTGTGLYWAHSYLNSNTAGNSVLSDRVDDLTIRVQDHVTTASTYRCIEGTFLQSVGSNGCGTYNLGQNFFDESARRYNIGGDYRCVQRGFLVDPNDPDSFVHGALGGDDFSTGSVRGVRDFDPLAVPPGEPPLANPADCDPTRGAFLYYTLVQDNLSTGGTLIISNGICLGTAQVEAACANAGFFTFTLGPDAVDDGPVDVGNGTSVDIAVGANDLRFIDPVTVTITTPPALAGATATVTNSPGPAAGIVISYSAPAGPAASDSFVYRVTDANGDSDTGTVSINVTGSGANDDFAQTHAADPVGINVAANDTGFTGPVTVTVDPLSFDQGGSATVSGSTVTYTSAWTPGTTTYVEHFTYQITDGTLTDTATVTVTVNNDAPGAPPATFVIDTKGEPAFIAGAGFKNVIQAAFGADDLGDGPSTIVCIGPSDEQIPASACTDVATASGKGGYRFDANTNQFTYAIQDETFLEGTDSFRYKIIDADGEEFDGLVTVDIPEAFAGQLGPDCPFPNPDFRTCDTGNEPSLDDIGTTQHLIMRNARPLPQILDDSPEDACIAAAPPNEDQCDDSVAPPGGWPATAVPYNPAFCLPDAEERPFSYCPLTIQVTEDRKSSAVPLPIAFGNGDEFDHTVEVLTDGAHGHCEVVANQSTGSETSITYEPDAGFIGTDQCEVRVTDGDAVDPNSDDGFIYLDVSAATGGGGGGGGLSGGSSSLDLWSLSLLLAAAGLRRRRLGVRGGSFMSIDRRAFLRATGMTAALMVTLAFLAVPRITTAQELEEIVVTARKQEEKLKEVPLAITAFDAAAIESANIQSLTDVAALTPGLSFFNVFGENLPTPVIRGIVPQDIFGANATAVFVDNVFVSARSGLNFSQLDIQRIEVVKGPQSALYGRNAFSGAINYVTKPPSDVFEAKSDVEAGNYGKQRVMAQVSGPLLGETLTGRLSGLYDYWDGSYDNTLAPDTNIGGYRYRSAQGRLRWRPADSLDINGALYFSNDEIDDASVAGTTANCEDRVEQRDEDRERRLDPRFQNWCGPMVDLDRMPDMVRPVGGPETYDDPWEIVSGSTTEDSMPKNALAQGENRDVTRGSLNIVWDRDFGTFSFLTGYTVTEHSSSSDFSRSAGETLPFLYCANGNTTGAPPICNPENPGEDIQFRVVPMGIYNLNNGDRIEEVSQEVRFTSPSEQRLRYSIGAYYFEETEKNYKGALIATTPFPQPGNYAGVPMNIPGPVPTGTALDIGGYIFGNALTADGTLDPLNRITSQVDTESWSFFGSTDLDLDDEGKWQFRGEIRYTIEELKGSANQYKRCALSPFEHGTADQTNYFPFNSPPVELCGDDYYDLRPADETLGTFLGPCLPNRDPLTQVPLNDGSCTPGTTSGDSREEFVTGRVGLKYQLNSDWMAYTSVAWGEKPGGLQFITANVVFPDGSIAPESIVNPFGPEKITAYELGIKGFTADRRIGLDMSVFYNDWTDIILRQLQEKSPKSGLPFQNIVGFNTNSGDARVWGWEATADLAITDDLTGRLTAAWTDSQLQNARMDTFSLFPAFYTDDPTCTPAAIQAIPDPTPDDTSNNENEAQNHKAVECQKLSGDVSGNTQMRQPEWTASASLSYKHQLTGEWNWFTRADANYVGKIFIGNDNMGWLNPRTNVNFRLGAESPRYSLEFWVRNLLNDDNPIAAFRDIFFTNNSDLQNQNRFSSDPAVAEAARRSNFDDFPPWRLSVNYPALRTYGIVGKVRFGGAEK